MPQRIQDTEFVILRDFAERMKRCTAPKGSPDYMIALRQAGDVCLNKLKLHGHSHTDALDLMRATLAG